MNASAAAPSTRTASRYAGYLFIAAAALCWGISASLGRAAFTGRLLPGSGITRIDPLILSQARTGFSFIALLIVLLAWRGGKQFRLPRRDLATLFLLGTAGVAATLPVLPAFPVEIAAETLVLVGIELKLIAELHEAYGSPAPGRFPERMSAYLAAWAHRRGVFMIEGGLIFAAGSPLARLLRRRLAIRAGRSAFSLGPMLTGAAAGALFNRRETRRLGRDIQRDLRRQQIDGPAKQNWWNR